MFSKMKAQLSLKTLMGMLLGVVFLVALLPTIALQVWTITVAGNNATLYTSAGLIMIGLIPLIVIAIFIVSVAKRVRG
jgi:hypothetical protein